MSDRNSLTTYVISGPKQMDDMMHAFDMFEPSKALATVKTFDLSFVGEASLDDRKKIVQAMKQAAEAGETPERVVAAFIFNDPETAYIDLTVKCISDGRKFQLLEPILKSCGVA